MGEKTTGLMLDSETAPEAHPQGTLGLDRALLLELELVSTLQLLHATLTGQDDDDGRRVAETVLTLSAAAGGGGSLKGNPIPWEGWSARSIAVYNSNAFAVRLGGGAGGVSLDSAGNLVGGKVVIGPNKLVVLPIAERVYTLAAAAASVAGADATLLVMRFKAELPPAVYALT